MTMKDQCEAGYELPAHGPCKTCGAKADERCKRAPLDELAEFADRFLWRTMEDAPRNGVNFLAIMENGTISVARYVTKNAFAADYLGTGNTDPAFWMPLPDPPKLIEE
jgi:hypothetical protein